MKPRFRLTANGADVTAQFGDRLLSLTVTDEDGDKADRLEITLDNRDRRLALPELEAELEIALGFKTLTPLGRYAVEGLRWSTPPLTLRITAVAVDLKKAARSPKTRAFEDKTLGEIVETLAGDAGLQPVVAPAIAGLRWDYLAQTAESPLHFLTRLARQIDATAKAADGRLIVMPRGTGKTATGAPLTPVEIAEASLETLEVELRSREVDGEVQAEWADTAGGATRRVSAGTEAPVRRLRQVFASEGEAQRAADARLRAARREALSLTARSAFRPALFAGGLVRPGGLPDAWAGDWTLTRVVHALTAGGLSTEFSARKELKP